MQTRPEITTSTEREADGIRYKVLRNGRVTWERFESFGRGRNRPAGPAFIEAARAQEENAHCSHEDMDTGANPYCLLCGTPK